MQRRPRFSNRTIDAAHRDVRYALRGMRRQPGFAAAIVVTFALAIAANATMFGTIDRLLLQPPPHIVGAESIARLGFQQRSTQSGELLTSTATTYADFVELRAHVDGFAELGVIGGPSDASLGRGEEAEIVRRAAVSASYFRVLGVRPALGRFFADEEDAPPRGVHVAVIGHGLWQRQFGGADDVIGRAIVLDNESFTVIGVAPRGFVGADLQPADVWIPVSVAAPLLFGEEWAETRNVIWLRPIARLRAPAEAAAVAAQASAVHARFYPDEYAADADRRVVLGPLLAARDEAFMQPAQQRAVSISLWLFGVAGIVLLIAAANVANLLLARTLRRRRELGVRLTLGVGGGRLAGQLFTEVLLLALAGAGLGLLLASWAGPLMRGVLLPGIEWQESAFGARMLLFSFGVVTLAALLAVAAPTLVALRVQTAELLAGARGSTYRRSRLRSGLVMLQAALSVLLLVGAGLFVRSLDHAHRVQLGYDADRIIFASWSTQALGRPPAERAALYEQAAARVQSLPQIEATALLWGTQPFLMRMQTSFSVPGRDSIPRPSDGGPWFSIVTPDYFRTFGTPILRGRGFTAQDREGSTPVAVISERMARIAWPDGDALGRCFHAGSADAPCTEVIGIAGDARMLTVDGEPLMQYYVPMAQASPAGHMLVARAAGDATAALAALRRELRALDASLPAPTIAALSERLEPQLRPWRLGATLFSAFGALALLLAVLGLYAVIAYDISQRRRELGVRLALGAPLAGLARMVLSDAARLALAGAGVGLLAALLLAGRLEALLFGVGARDPLVYVAVAALLLAFALAAAALPARRATRVNPLEALSSE